MKQESKLVRGSWAAGFTVASVWFGTHVGGGFATGNQIVQYFTKYGWTAAVYPLLSMGLLAYMVVQKRLCKPPLSGKIKMTMGVLLWQGRKKANSGK